MIFPEERKISLQMFFVFYPITVLVVNKEQKVVEIKENFRPFTFWSSRKEGKYVVEVGRKHPVVKTGDRIEFDITSEKTCRGILTPEDALTIRKKFRVGFVIHR